MAAFSVNQPRQYGKTYFLLKRASEDGNALVISPTIRMSKCLYERMKDEYETELCDDTKMIILLKNRNIVKFSNTINQSGNVYVDEVTLFLQNYFNCKLKGYTDTSLRVELKEPEWYKENIKIMKEYLTEEQYQLEALAEYIGEE